MFHGAFQKLLHLFNLVNNEEFIGDQGAFFSEQKCIFKSQKIYYCERRIYSLAIHRIQN